MDIREADPADVRTVSEIRQRRALDFLSADALLRLRARLDILMPRRPRRHRDRRLCARRARHPRRRAGWLPSAICSPWSTRARSLGPLRRRCYPASNSSAWAFDADEIQLSAEHAAGFLAQLEQSGDRPHGSGADSSFGVGPGPRLLKRLNAVRPISVARGSA